MEIIKIQKEANDLQQQKIDVLETQPSLLNNPLNNQEINSFW